MSINVALHLICATWISFAAAASFAQTKSRSGQAHVGLPDVLYR